MVMLFALLSACVANPAIKESERLAADGRSDEAAQRLEQAMREDPADRELRTLYFRQREMAVGQLLASANAERAARRLDAAEALYQRVQKLEPSNQRMRDGLADIAAQRRYATLVTEAEALMEKGDTAVAERGLRTILSESPAHPQAKALLQKLRDQVASAEAAAAAQKSLFNKPITLEFRDTPLRTVFEVMSRSSGINFVFDKDVRSDNKVTIFVRNTSVDEVVRLILATNQLERKLLNDTTMLIYPNTPAKAKDYVELVTRSFYLSNADVKQALSMLRTLVKTKDIFTDEKLNLIVIKDTPDAVRLAGRLLESLDMAEPEVMLDVEVLEISRSKMQELGLRFPDQIGYGLLQPSTTSSIFNSSGGVIQSNTNLGGALSTGYVDLSNTGALTSFVSNPALTLNLKNQIGDGNLLANPRIRVKNREKAKIHIGDKLPVFTTTSTANVGVAASVSYLDVGLKLEVEPNVFLDDEVSIKVGLEVSSVVREVPGPSSSLAYQIGTRSASTVLRLMNGETQVLAGLINDEERTSANRLPGLGELPGVGRLFSSQKDSKNKTEIVLLITPRIVRNLSRAQTLSTTLPAGSEASIGAAPLQVKSAEPRSLSLSGSGVPSAPGFTPSVGPDAPPAPQAQPVPEPVVEVTPAAPVTVPDSNPLRPTP
jgi:general secretion pathway protein D